MKKFLFGFLALAVITASAFAETTVGGRAAVTYNVIGNNNTLQNGGVDGLSDAITVSGRIDLKGTDADGKIGAWLRFQNGWNGDKGDSGWAWLNHALVWWKPIDQFKLQLGRNADGEFGRTQIIGWGFNAGADDMSVGIKARNLSKAFSQGFDGIGAYLTITPMEALNINAWLPIEKEAWLAGKDGKYDLTDFGIQVVYNLGIGEVSLTYENGSYSNNKNSASDNGRDYTANWSDGPFYRGVGKIYNGLDDPWGKNFPAFFPAFSAFSSLSDVDTGAFYLSFYGKLSEQLSLNAGVRYALPVTVEFGGGAEVTYNQPIAIGVGVEFTQGDLGVRAGLNFDFLGSIALNDKADAFYSKGVEVKAPFNFNIGLLPYYDLGILKAFFGIGANFIMDQEKPIPNATDTDWDETNHKGVAVSFYVNPYVVKSVGAGNFYAGAYLIIAPVDKQQSKDWDSTIQWSIPVGLEYNF